MTNATKAVWLVKIAIVTAFCISTGERLRDGSAPSIVAPQDQREVADAQKLLRPNSVAVLSRASNLATIRRLRNIQGAESATVDYWSRKLMEGTAESINRSRAEDMAIIDSIGAHQAKLYLATRDLNRFMR